MSNAVGTVVNMMNPLAMSRPCSSEASLRKWRGRLVGVDLDRTFQLAEAAREAVMRRAGFSVNLLG